MGREEERPCVGVDVLGVVLLYMGTEGNGMAEAVTGERGADSVSEDTRFREI